MHFYSSLRAASLLGLAALALLPGVAQAAPSYTLTEIGTFPGGTYSIGTGVNDSGQVTGTSYTGDGKPTGTVDTSRKDGFLYQNGTMTYISTLGGFNSYGIAINNKGQVLAQVGNDAYLTGANGQGLIGLPFLPGTGNNSNAGLGVTDVNDSGQVTGNATTSNGNGHAFLSGPNGGPLTDLGTFGGYSSVGNSVNSSGQVTGYAQLKNSRYFHGFLTGANGQGLTDIGLLPDGTYSDGYGVNDSGQVTGQADIAGGNRRAFLYQNGTITNLGTLAGGNGYSYGFGINNSGDIVGYSSASDGFSHAFLYQNGVMLDLNSLIDPTPTFTLTQAYGISNTGYITGEGVNSSGQQEAFLLTPTDLNPVPEASTTVSLGVLLTLGMGGMMWKARRKA